MSRQTYPYKYFQLAGLCTILLFIAGYLSENGENLLLKIPGVILLFLSIIFWIAPVFALKKHGHIEPGKPYFETQVIVTGGIYSLIRHPQYLAYIFLVSGFALIYQNWTTYGLALLAIFFFNIHTIQEEKEMLEKFGLDYKQYCETVPRFNLFRNSTKLLRNWRA